MKRDIVILNEASDFGRMLLINNFSQQEARLVAYYAQELDEKSQQRRLCAMLGVPPEFIFPERPRKPYYLRDGTMILPIAPTPTPEHRALLKAIAEYDPVKYLVGGGRLEWPVWRPLAPEPRRR